MRARSVRVRAVALIALTPILLSTAAVDVSDAAEVRLVHAVPGGAPASLLLTGGTGREGRVEGVPFGEASPYTRAPSGRVMLILDAEDDELARRRATLGDGRYTVLATRNDSGGATLRVLDDGGATPSRARLRVVHAAAEVDGADFLLGSRSIGSVERGGRSSYTTVEPGSYTLLARRPGSRDALVRTRTALPAGTASTAFLVGSGGERIRFVVAEDSAAAPGEAPATGLGGLSGGPRWLEALLAALAAGALGGAMYLRAAGRGRATG
jgi:hypothetical protein